MSSQPRELALDAEISRARFDLAIDRLENRLSPMGLVDEAIGLMRRSASLPVVSEGLRSMRRNPLPVILIATGAGLMAWRVWQQQGSVSNPTQPRLKTGNAGAERDPNVAR